MVLWEITLGTAYFLGLKRTYKLALKIQRKLIRPKHRRIRDFVQRRTRNVFDAALRVHLAIQERDIEVGRDLGNRILRWLDRMKPDAQIRKPTPPTSANIKMQQSHPNGLSKRNTKSSGDGESNKRLFAVARNVWPKPFTMMRPTCGNSIQHRRYSSAGFQHFSVNNTKFGFGLRNDIKDWILHH